MLTPGNFTHKGNSHKIQNIKTVEFYILQPEKTY